MAREVTPVRAGSGRFGFEGRVGLGACIAVVLTLLIFVVAFGIMRIVDRDQTT